MRIGLLASALTCGLLAACSGTSTPQSVVDAYADAIDSDNANRAFGLTSPEYQAATPRARFEDEFDRRVEAGRDLVDALRDSADGPAHVRAVAPTSDMESIELELRDGEWVIVDGVGSFFSQASPRDALRTFVRALRTNDVATLLRLVPGEYRAQIDETTLEEWLALRVDELAETLALLEASIDAPIQQRDAEATIRYGAREMRFSREGNRWVIEDFDH